MTFLSAASSTPTRHHCTRTRPLSSANYAARSTAHAPDLSLSAKILLLLRISTLCRSSNHRLGGLRLIHVWVSATHSLSTFLLQGLGMWWLRVLWHLRSILASCLLCAWNGGLVMLMYDVTDVRTRNIDVINCIPIFTSVQVRRPHWIRFEFAFFFLLFSIIYEVSSELSMEPDQLPLLANVTGQNFILIVDKLHHFNIGRILHNHLFWLWVLFDDFPSEWFDGAFLLWNHLQEWWFFGGRFFDFLKRAHHDDWHMVRFIFRSILTALFSRLNKAVLESAQFVHHTSL